MARSGNKFWRYPRFHWQLVPVLVARKQVVFAWGVRFVMPDREGFRIWTSGLRPPEVGAIVLFLRFSMCDVIGGVFPGGASPSAFCGATLFGRISTNRGCFAFRSANTNADTPLLRHILVGLLCLKMSGFLEVGFVASQLTVLKKVMLETCCLLPMDQSKLPRVGVWNASLVCTFFTVTHVSLLVELHKMQRDKNTEIKSHEKCSH